MPARHLSAILSVLGFLAVLASLAVPEPTAIATPARHANFEAKRQVTTVDGVTFYLVDIPDPQVPMLSRRCLVFRDVEFELTRATCLP